MQTHCIDLVCIYPFIAYTFIPSKFNFQRADIFHCLHVGLWGRKDNEMCYQYAKIIFITLQYKMKYICDYEAQKMCSTNVYKMRPIIYQSNMCIVAINRTQSIIPFPCLNFSENKSWQDNFFRIQKTSNTFMFIIYNNEWQHILPFPSFLLSKKCRAKTEYVFCAHIGNKFWFASH